MVLSATFAMATAAWGAVPSNDNRANAVLVHPPQSLSGTLVEATVEATNDSSGCVGTDASVWYHFTAPEHGSIVIQMDAAGEMDAPIDLFKQVRSRLTFAGCDSTDAQGKATIDRDGLVSGADYAIRIGNEVGSVADTFVLRVLVPTAPPEPPGRHLPAAGVRDRVDRVLNPGDAYWTRMVAGHTMRLSLRTQQCTSLEVFGPGTKSFTARPAERTLRCGGFALFTPTTSGRHFLVVRAARGRDVQHYALRVAPAGPDDTTPGVLIKNHAKVRGSVNGGIDTRDLFRFDVTRRSALRLALWGGPTMILVRENGRFVSGGNPIGLRVRPGRYFVAVSGSGRYSLRLTLRVITHATLVVDGRHVATLRPGSAARLSLRVRPAVSGPSLITVERFDPIEGWQFLRKLQPRVSKGSATAKFTPPSVGRYRAHAAYLGSHDAAPSATGFARFQVERPLGH